MKYILAQTFGKQYIFKPNELYDVNLKYDFKLNTFLFLNKILLFKNNLKLQIGQPFLNNSQILIKILQKINQPKITILKTKPKKKYTRIKGYKIKFTRIYIIN